MEHLPSTDHVPIYRGISVAMFDYQRVIGYHWFKKTTQIYFMHLTTVVKSKCLLLDKYILFIVLSYSCLPLFLVKASPTFFFICCFPVQTLPFPAVQFAKKRRNTAPPVQRKLPKSACSAAEEIPNLSSSCYSHHPKCRKVGHLEDSLKVLEHRWK